jgi:hypothetical protein
LGAEDVDRLCFFQEVRSARMTDDECDSSLKNFIHESIWQYRRKDQHSSGPHNLASFGYVEATEKSRSTIHYSGQHQVLLET